MTSNTTAGNDVRRRIQFNLRTAFLVVTACAIVIWITVEVGFIPIVGALGAILIGGTAGAIVGLPFGSPLRSTVVGAIAALAAVGIVIIWLLSVLAWELLSRGERFPVVIPLKVVMHDWLFLTAAMIALLGAVPAASIAAVHNRKSDLTVLWPTFTCAVFTLVGGLLFFAYCVWIDGGFPRPPLPWPIALAISLGSAVIGTALVGLTAGLIWLLVRSTWPYIAKGRFPSSNESARRPSP